MTTPRDARSGAIAFGGAALIVLGVWLFLTNTGIIPQYVLDLINRSAGAVTLIALGVIVILLSRRGSFTTPRTGTRLYRSRSDRMLGGVLGGLGPYVGIDPTFLRIIVAVLTVLGPGSFLVIAYIVMWVVVPEEPLGAVFGSSATTVASAPPVPPAPAPPAPPVPGE
jgi:phage shock protein C